MCQTATNLLGTLAGEYRMPEPLRHTTIRVLLIEDSESDAELMKDALEEGSLEVNVKVVGDGEDALRYLGIPEGAPEQPRPDLILLDLCLPKLHGLEVLSQIKEDSALRQIPVVVLTASQRQEEHCEVYLRQGNCCVLKPVDPDEFAEAVRQIESFWTTIASRSTKRPPPS